MTLDHFLTTAFADSPSPSPTLNRRCLIPVLTSPRCRTPMLLSSSRPHRQPLHAKMPDPTPGGVAPQHGDSKFRAESLPDAVSPVAHSTGGEPAVVTAPRKRRPSQTEAAETPTLDTVHRAAHSSDKEPTVVTAPPKRRRRRSGAVAQAPLRTSRRLARVDSGVSFKGGSCYDNALNPTVSQGKYNPNSKTSKYNLQHTQARTAHQRAKDKGIYSGDVAVPHQGKMVVIAKFSGGWKEGRYEHRFFHFQGELHSRNFKGKWEPGRPHGEGTIEWVWHSGC